MGDETEVRFDWTAEAQARLQRVPEGVMRDLTRQRVETLAGKLGETTVTPELMDEKYHQWAEGSARASSELAWTDEAREKVDRIPSFVRGMVVEAVEAYGIRQGRAEITADMLEEVKGFWGGSGSFHHP